MGNLPNTKTLTPPLRPRAPMSLFGTLASLGTPGDSLGGAHLASGGASSSSGSLDDGIARPSFGFDSQGIGGGWGSVGSARGEDAVNGGCGSARGRRVIGAW